ncbi:YggS family pyridoxal phosphate-dependent enzyme [Baekduia sp. Peel2402]|uniref:YggS family pyridoxal phosphate-dependent enzyme n=1 Tax=Baekduia sp. Peel2402 TaxID=3458296 RepID=UPI00403E44AE
MAELITGLSADAVRANVERVQSEIADAAVRAGRSADAVQLLAAVKYVALEEIPVLAEAGITLAGENRAQELVRKVEAPGGDALTWDFIGHLQSRKVKQILPLVRMIHSVGSDSVVEQLGKHAQAGTKILVEVNIASEEGKSGIAPDRLDAFLDSCRAVENVEVAGLMTMPPLAQTAEDSRRWFAALAQLAADRDLPELSMGTTQDFAVAVEEGATIVRVGTKLYR